MSARALRTALGAWVVSRALVVLTLFVTRAALADATGERALVLDRGLRAWDAAFYGDIAAGGYGAVDPAGLRFFPLLPLLGRLVNAITPLHDAGGVVVVANLAALGALVAIHRLAEHELDAAGADVAVWVTALAPSAFVLVMGYAESLFLPAAAAALLAVRRGRWWSAVPWAVAAGLTRPTGLLLVVPILYEALVGWRAVAADVRAVVARLAAVAAAPAGVLAYLVAVRDRTDTLLEPLRIHDDERLRGGFRNPLAATADALGDLLSGDRFASGIHFVTIIVLVGLLVVLGRHGPRSFFAYGLVSVIVSVSAHNLDSLERYSLATVPLLLAATIALRTIRRAPFVLAGSAAVMCAAAATAFAGNVVP